MTVPETPVLGRPLPDGRLLVITTRERFFVHEPATGTSTSDLSGVDHDALLVLLARARGWSPDAESADDDLSLNKGEQTAPNEYTESGTADSRKSLDDVVISADPGTGYEGETAEHDVSPLTASTGCQIDTAAENAYLDLDGDGVAEDPSLFRDLLQSSNLNPFLPWEAQRDRLIDDERYEAVETNERRHTLYDGWAAEARLNNTQPESSDVQGENVIANVQSELGISYSVKEYVALIKEKHKPALFYVEFKRKLRKDQRFLNTQLPDKEKEKLYRAYTLFMKKSSAERDALLRELTARAKEAESSPSVHLSERELLLRTLFL